MPTGPRSLLRPKQWAVRLVEGWSSGPGATTLWTWLGADTYLQRLPFEPAVRDADSMSSPTKTDREVKASVFVLEVIVQVVQLISAHLDAMFMES